MGAVVAGIVPKMAIRFSSFELYKSWMTDPSGKISTTGIFLGKYLLLMIIYDHSHLEFSLAGLAAGTTEAVCVVSIADMIKIRY